MNIIKHPTDVTPTSLKASSFSVVACDVTKEAKECKYCAIVQCKKN